MIPSADLPNKKRLRVASLRDGGYHPDASTLLTRSSRSSSHPGRGVEVCSGGPDAAFL